MLSLTNTLSVSRITTFFASFPGLNVNGSNLVIFISALSIISKSKVRGFNLYLCNKILKKCITICHKSIEIKKTFQR